MPLCMLATFSWLDKGPTGQQAAFILIIITFTFIYHVKNFSKWRQ